MLFPPKAVERAMQLKEVMLRAMNKEYSCPQEAGAQGLLRRDVAVGRQSSPVAEAGGWAQADADPGRRRCDQSIALRAAVGGRDGPSGDERAQRGHCPVRDPRLPLYGPRGM